MTSRLAHGSQCSVNRTCDRWQRRVLDVLFGESLVCIFFMSETSVMLTAVAKVALISCRRPNLRGGSRIRTAYRGLETIREQNSVSLNAPRRENCHCNTA